MRRRTAFTLTAGRRTYLVAGVWLGRVLLVWLLAYPLYRLLGSSAILQGTYADRRLFAPGAETLLALLEGRLRSLPAYQTTLWFVGLLGVAIAIAASSLVWVAVDPSVPLMGGRLWLKWRRVLPGFVLTTAYSTGGALLLGWCWWQLFPVVGALVDPWLGERGTDYFQLGGLGCLLVALSVLFVLADAVRAVLASGPGTRAGALSAGLDLFWQQPLGMCAQALVRFGLAWSLQISCGWLVAHHNLLVRSDTHAAFAVVLGELSALATVALRIDWILWVSQRARHIESPQPCLEST